MSKTKVGQFAGLVDQESDRRRRVNWPSPRSTVLVGTGTAIPSAALLSLPYASGVFIFSRCLR
jgi:hypothetical protein